MHFCYKFGRGKTWRSLNQHPSFMGDTLLAQICCCCIIPNPQQPAPGCKFYFCTLVQLHCSKSRFFWKSTTFNMRLQTWLGFVWSCASACGWARRSAMPMGSSDRTALCAKTAGAVVCDSRPGAANPAGPPTGRHCVPNSGRRCMRLMPWGCPSLLGVQEVLAIVAATYSSPAYWSALGLRTIGPVGAWQASTREGKARAR